VDTNPIVFMIRNAKPQSEFWWVRCHSAGTREMRNWVANGFSSMRTSAFSVSQRRLDEGVATGLSRQPSESLVTGPTLGNFAKVLRGVATGANEFFFLTDEQVQNLKLPSEYLLPAIGRTRDVPDNEITRQILTSLRAQGRPTWLLALDGKPLGNYPKSIQHYIIKGEELGLPEKPLISQRRPWYKMESRVAPPILFAYLGRRNSRFIRNFAGVVPLTCFLCVYPHRNDLHYIESLWPILNHPDTLANLPLIGKSYGSGAIKVEPRALEKLPIPEHMVINAKIQYEPHLFT